VTKTEVAMGPEVNESKRRDGRQGVGVVHSTCEVGEPAQRDPMEG